LVTGFASGLGVTSGVEDGGIVVVGDDVLSTGVAQPAPNMKRLINDPKINRTPFD
jgi:hypothetical protein